MNWLGNKKTKLMGDLNLFIDNLINERNQLAEKLRNYNKDEQIAKLIEANDKLRINSLHVLSDKEQEQFDAFRQFHWEKCKGNTRFILTGTGIGTAVDVQCTNCNEKKDITDHANW